MHAIAPANSAPQLPERVLSRGADAMKTLLVGNHFLVREALRGVLKAMLREGGLLGEFTGQLAGVRHMFDGYHPERHYMRGPGPAWHAKHAAVPESGWRTGRGCS